MIKHVDKFCLDILEEKEEYEELLNREGIAITDTKLINGQSQNPRVFVIVYWVEMDVGSLD